MKHVLGFNDSFVSYYRNDTTLFQIEFHFPILCPFIKFVKIFLECSCVCLRLKSRIHYGVISKESNCTCNIVWNVVNVKKEYPVDRDQVQNLVGLLVLHGLQRRLVGTCQLKML